MAKKPVIALHECDSPGHILPAAQGQKPETLLSLRRTPLSPESSLPSSSLPGTDDFRASIKSHDSYSTFVAPLRGNVNNQSLPNALRRNVLSASARGSDLLLLSLYSFLKGQGPGRPPRLPPQSWNDTPFSLPGIHTDSRLPAVLLAHISCG